MENTTISKKWYKKWWAILLYIIISIPILLTVLGILGTAFFKIFCSLPIPEGLPAEEKRHIQASCSGQIGQIQNKQINLLPMYGGVEKTEDQKRVDEIFINTIVNESGDRKKGSILVADAAKKILEQGDLDTAMKRFNQAWLLDNNNPDVFIGFGDILKKQGNEEEAAEMYKKAEELKR